MFLLFCRIVGLPSPYIRNAQIKVLKLDYNRIKHVTAGKKSREDVNKGSTTTNNMYNGYSLYFFLIFCSFMVVWGWGLGLGFLGLGFQLMRLWACDGVAFWVFLGVGAFYTNIEQ